MPQRYSSVDLRSRIALDSTSDLGISAYTRRQRRRRVLFGLFGSILIIVALVLYLMLRPANSLTDMPLLTLKCSACGAVTTERVAITAAFPLACRACEHQTCRPIWICRKCGETFLPGVAAGLVHCPKCGSDSVGGMAQSPKAP